MLWLGCIGAAGRSTWYR